MVLLLLLMEGVLLPITCYDVIGIDVDDDDGIGGDVVVVVVPFTQ